MESTVNRVRKVVAEIMSLNKERVTPETNIVLDLGPDSLEIVEIVQELEDEFSFDMGDDHEALGTIQQLADRIDELIQKHGADLTPIM